MIKQICRHRRSDTMADTMLGELQSQTPLQAVLDLTNPRVSLETALSRCGAAWGWRSTSPPRRRPGPGCRRGGHGLTASARVNASLRTPLFALHRPAPGTGDRRIGSGPFSASFSGPCAMCPGRPQLPANACTSLRVGRRAPTGADRRKSSFLPQWMTRHNRSPL